MKDGVVLAASGTYQMTQILHSGITATYFNLLKVNAGPYAVIGDYSCQVSNQLGSDTRNTSFRGLFKTFDRGKGTLIDYLVQSTLEKGPNYILILLF